MLPPKNPQSERPKVNESSMLSDVDESSILSDVDESSMLSDVDESSILSDVLPGWSNCASKSPLVLETKKPTGTPALKM